MDRFSTEKVIGQYERYYEEVLNARARHHFRCNRELRDSRNCMLKTVE